MSLQKGTKGVSWSFRTNVSWVVGTVTCTGKVQSVEYELDGEVKRLFGDDGIIFNKTFHQDLEKCTVEVIPTGQTKALGDTSNIVPSRGDDITVTDVSANTVTDVDVAGAGTVAGTSLWCLVRAKKKKTVDAEARITMDLEREEVHLPTVA